MVHSSLSTSMYSSHRAPRRSQGTPRAAYSSCDHPTPTPSRKRPAVNWSTVATSLAVMSGLRSPSSRIDVPSLSDVVERPAAVSAANGSKRPGSRPSSSLPLSLYGYRDSYESKNTMCSGTQSDSKPTSSTLAANSRT